MRLRTRPTSNQSGSIFVELVFFLPVIILIWTLLNFIYDAKRAAVVTQTEVRECAWAYATGGCTSLSGQCQGGAPGKVDDQRLRSAAGNSFNTLQQGLNGSQPNYSSLHGRMFLVTTQQNVKRPSILGGSTTAKGRHATMCADDPVRKWTKDEVYKELCRAHGKSSWCKI